MKRRQLASFGISNWNEITCYRILYPNKCIEENRYILYVEDIYFRLSLDIVTCWIEWGKQIPYYCFDILWWNGTMWEVNEMIRKFINNKLVSFHPKLGEEEKIYWMDQNGIIFIWFHSIPPYCKQPKQWQLVSVHSSLSVSVGSKTCNLKSKVMHFLSACTSKV